MSMDTKNLKELAADKWRVRFKYKHRLTGDTKVVERVFHGSLADARRHRDELKRQARKGDLEGGANMRVKDFLEMFYGMRAARGGKRGRQLAPSTLKRDEFALKDHIIPAIGDWLLSEIRPMDLERVVDEWVSTEKPEGGYYSNATINVWIKVTKIYLRYVYRTSGMGASPAEDLECMPKPESKGVALSASQVKEFLAKTEDLYPQHYAIIFMGFATGARFGELTALHWDDIDEQAGVIHFAHSQYEGYRRKLTKTHKYIQRPLTDKMLDVLKDHRARLRREDHPAKDSVVVFPARINPKAAVWSGYLSRNALLDAMRRVSSELGLPRVTPHDMRRTFNTLMLESGISTQLLKAMTGHSTDTMVVHYAHVSRERKAEAVESLLDEIGVNNPA